MQPRPRLRLGELLEQRKLIDKKTLEGALETHKRHGVQLGKILLSEGAVTPLKLYQALAEQQGMPFANLLAHPPEDGVVEPERHAEYLRHMAVPWRKPESGTLVATSELTEDVKSWARERYGSSVRFVLTSPRDIRWTVERYCADALTKESTSYLWQRSPDRSAKVLMPSKHRPFLIAGLLALLGLGVVYPSSVLLTIACAANAVYFSTVLLKIMLFAIGASYRTERRKRPKPEDVPVNELPVYTLLIPLYNEAKTLPRLIKAISVLDYPKSKLDVKLIIEEDDKTTFEAAKALAPEDMFEILRVPFSLPRTKPKACNYALRFARGEMVAIYDAEDEPHPRQLKDTVAHLRAAGKDVMCVQARLNYYNPLDNMLTRLFAIEYASWFDYLLWGLEKLRLPIPLGGTSNHLPRKILEKLGEWDPYNVTEDADLGIRIAAVGWRTEVLDSLTEEEAPNTLGAWFKQRARWIKGYMQTWFVHMRAPIELWRNLGPRGFWGFQFFIGGPALVFLMTPFVWAFSLLWVTGAVTVPQSPLTLILLWCAIINVIDATVINFLIGAFVMRQKQREWEWPRNDAAGAVAAFPFYWLLHSLACFRAVWQLFTKPHHWDKTEHGLNKTRH